MRLNHVRLLAVGVTSPQRGEVKSGCLNLIETRSKVFAPTQRTAQRESDPPLIGAASARPTEAPRSAAGELGGGE